MSPADPVRELVGNARRYVVPMSGDERPEPPDEAAQATTRAPSFVRVPIADLSYYTPPSPDYVWQDYVPKGVVTLLGAHGGVGKSTLGLQLAICVALGLPCLGVSTKQGKVVFFSGEDGADLLRHRLHWICRLLNVDPAALDGKLHILDATGNDPTLYAETNAAGVRSGRTTPAYDDLAELMHEVGAGLLIVDNASDTFAASEIDRARVREFMRSLARLAVENAAGVVLVAHVNKLKASGRDTSSENYSGSTAWHNSARSRLALARDRDGLTLTHEKANLGQMREPLHITWQNGGVMQADEPPSGMMASIKHRNDMQAILALVHEFASRREYVSTATAGRGAAPAAFAKEPSFPKGLKPVDVFDLLRQAERKQLIERWPYRGADRKPREGWRLTPAGLEAIGVPTAGNAANAAMDD